MAADERMAAEEGHPLTLALDDPVCIGRSSGVQVPPSDSAHRLPRGDLLHDDDNDPAYVVDCNDRSSVDIGPWSTSVVRSYSESIPKLSSTCVDPSATSKFRESYESKNGDGHSSSPEESDDGNDDDE